MFFRMYFLALNSLEPTQDKNILISFFLYIFFLQLTQKREKQTYDEYREELNNIRDDLNGQLSVYSSCRCQVVIVIIAFLVHFKGIEEAVFLNE